MKDYLVKVSVKNNYLWQAMQRAGFSTGAELARASGVPPQKISGWFTLRLSGQDATGEWFPDVIRLSGTLGCLPEDLFPPQHVREPLATQETTFEASIDDVQAFLGQQESRPDRLLESAATKKTIDRVLDTLMPRERRVIEMRFGLNGVGPPSTLAKIAEEFGVGKERIRQIESGALRKLRAPARKRHMKDAAEMVGLSPDVKLPPQKTAAHWEEYRRRISRHSQRKHPDPPEEQANPFMT